MSQSPKRHLSIGSAVFCTVHPCDEHRQTRGNRRLSNVRKHKGVRPKGPKIEAQRAQARVRFMESGAASPLPTN